MEIAYIIWNNLTKYRLQRLQEALKESITFIWLCGEMRRNRRPGRCRKIAKEQEEQMNLAVLCKLRCVRKLVVNIMLHHNFISCCIIRLPSCYTKT